MVALNYDFVREDLKEIFVDLYQRTPERFNDDVRILADLHADSPNRNLFEIWISRAARKLGVENKSLKIEEKDYTIREIVEELRNSKRRASGKGFYSVSKAVPEID